MRTAFIVYYLVVMYFYIPFVILAGLRLLFVSFPAVICAKREAYHRYKVSYLVKWLFTCITYAVNCGRHALPTIAITRKAEPLFVWLPSP